MTEPMRIWLITVGEPLPTDGDGCRLLRTGLLAEQLVQGGHAVTWWTSAFNHTHRTYRSSQDVWQEVGPDFRIRLLRSCGYRTNISLRRLLDHRHLAQKFSREARSQAAPDVILCSLPTLELCDGAVAYGREVGRPVVIDVRDLWPDVFLDLAPRGLRALAGWALEPLHRTASRACAGATAIVGISEPFIEWGVRHGGRPRKSHDRVFPLGYREQAPSPSEIINAMDYWRQLGIGSNSDSFVACFFGSINRHFEIPTVIDAARILASESRNVQLVLCGDGEKLSEWKSLAAECPQIVFPGWLNAAKIWTLMRMSDAGLAPYVSSSNFVGNLPNKPIEYLSSSLPIVSSLQGTLADLLARHGCGVTYRNADARGLAAAITFLMDQPDERHRMAKNARRLYQQQFVAETVYGQMEQYLVDLANGRRTAAA